MSHAKIEKPEVDLYDEWEDAAEAEEEVAAAARHAEGHKISTPEKPHVPMSYAATAKAAQKRAAEEAAELKAAREKKAREKEAREKAAIAAIEKAAIEKAAIEKAAEEKAARTRAAQSSARESATTSQSGTPKKPGRPLAPLDKRRSRKEGSRNHPDYSAWVTSKNPQSQ